MAGKRLIKITGLYRKHPSFAGNDRRVAQEICHRSTVQRGGHHEQAEIRAKEPLRFETKSQARIGLHAPFVEFIEEDDRVRAECRIVLEQARENAFRHHFNSGIGTHLRVEPHAVADRFTDRITQRGSHAIGCGAGCKPPRFQHEHCLSVEPGASSKASGTRVVFPAPGAAVSSAFRPSVKVRRRVGSTSSIGSLDMIGSVLTV